MPEWQRAGIDHLWMPYTQMATAPRPLPVVRTEAAHLILDDGRRILDGMASWWTACHGYNHPHLQTTIAEQLRVMPHVMFGGIQHPQAARLARRLATLLPGDLNHVFFCDSGSVAIEVAMKMAVQYWLNRGSSGRHTFVTFQHAYHGDTLGAMSACDPLNSMHAHFQGYLPKQFCLPLPQTRDELAEFERFLRRRRDEIAGILLEPLVQGAGGMKFHAPETLAAIVKVCREQDLLFIADEIATGFGRTGTMFACEQAEVVPDICCLGKALTGGMISLAATAARDHIFDAFWNEDPRHALMHGPTYMANPLACAAANGSLDLFEQEPRLAQAMAIGATLGAALQSCTSFPGVLDVRCRGAIGVVQVERLHSLDWLRARFVERGIWLRPFRDMIYTTPPLTLSAAELSHLGETMVNVIGEWSRRG